MSATQQSIEDGGGVGGIGGSGTLNRIAMFTPDGLNIGDSIILQSPTVTLPNSDNTGSTDGLIIGNNTRDVNGVRNFGIGLSNDFSVNDIGSEDIYLIGTTNTINDRVRGAIILGFANNFFGIDSQGVYLIGDSNNITDELFSTIIGEQNTVEGNSYNILIGLFSSNKFNADSVQIGNNNNIENNSQCVIVGGFNDLTNSSNTNVIGNENIAGTKTNATVIGNTNFSGIIDNQVFVGNNDKGITVDQFGRIGIGTYSPTNYLHIVSAFYSGGIQVNAANNAYLNLYGLDGGVINIGREFAETPMQIQGNVGSGGIIRVTNSFAIRNWTNNEGILRVGQVDTYPIWAMGNHNAGTILEAKTRLVIYGQNVLATDFILKLKDGNNLGAVNVFTARNDGHIAMEQLPTSNAGLVAGELWNNAGVVNIV
jgi:hypothetical protein